MARGDEHVIQHKYTSQFPTIYTLLSIKGTPNAKIKNQKSRIRKVPPLQGPQGPSYNIK